MKLLLLGTIALLAACDRAPSNVKTLVITDCVSCTVVSAGQRVSTSIGRCEYKTVLPDYPMQGNTDFQAHFADNVLVKIRIAYDYEIVKGLKSIKKAEELGFICCQEVTRLEVQYLPQLSKYKDSI